MSILTRVHNSIVYLCNLWSLDLDLDCEHKCVTLDTSYFNVMENFSLLTIDF